MGMSMTIKPWDLRMMRYMTMKSLKLFETHCDFGNKENSTKPLIIFTLPDIKIG